jgi:pectinesterase
MKKVASLFFVGLLSLSAFSAERADIIVAKDGAGKFTSIQSAINSIPQNNSQRVIILVKKGVYNEKLFITKSFISIVGEDQESTRIVYAELRKNWLKKNPNDWGSATVNIDSTVTNLTIANVTIQNNYGSLYGDHDHQFAILGKGTRIILLYCNVIGDGGDTVSLWNSENGMYYHSNCSFEGWVDYVCPRGWCYITDSRFYGHNLSASLWHHGSGNEDQKFVIRYSYFDGVPGFPLGRHHVDGQFYLLDCIFSKNLADEQIHYPAYSPNAKPWKWGERHYYFNCHREGGDFDWFQDNLQSAKGSPDPDDVTPRWTFAGKWDPEKEIQSLLPFVSCGTPRFGEYNVDPRRVLLQWYSSRNSNSRDVYFGTEKNPPLRAATNESSFSPGLLERNCRYYWRIDEISDRDTIVGPLWHFTTY